MALRVDPHGLGEKDLISKDAEQWLEGRVEILPGTELPVPDDRGAVEGEGFVAAEVGISPGDKSPVDECQEAGVGEDPVEADAVGGVDDHGTEDRIEEVVEDVVVR